MGSNVLTWENMVNDGYGSSANIQRTYVANIGWVVVNESSGSLVFVPDSAGVWGDNYTVSTTTSSGGPTTTTVSSSGSTASSTTTGSTGTTTTTTSSGSTTTASGSTSSTSTSSTPATSSTSTTSNSTASGSTSSTSATNTTSVSQTTGSTSSTPTLYYIWQNGAVANGFRDYSYNGTYSTDAYGDKVGKLGAWGAISWNNNNNVSIPSQNYLGVELTIKSDGNQKVSVALYSSSTQVGTSVSITPASSFTTIQILWSQFNLLAGASFTNLLITNLSGTALANPIYVSMASLIVNPNPQPVQVVLPPLDPNPVPANSNGLTVLQVKGTKAYDAYGNVFFGRGTNVFDNYLDGSGVGTAPSTGAQEAIRRIQFAYDGGCDYFRLLLQAFDSSGGITQAGQLMNNSAYLSAVKSIVSFIGTLPGARVSLCVDIDASLSPPAGGESTLATGAVLTQLVYSFYKCQNVMFSLYNEPSGNSTTTSRMALLNIINQNIQAVRTAEAKVGSVNHPIIIGGIDNYAREVLWYVANPPTDSANNLIFSAHIYDPNGDQWWNEYITASNSLCLECAEFGPATSGTVMSQADCMTWQQQLEKLGTSYTFWACDPMASPAALTNNTNGGSGIGSVLSWNNWGLAIVNAIRTAKGLPAVKADNSLA